MEAYSIMNVEGEVSISITFKKVQWSQSWQYVVGENTNSDDFGFKYTTLRDVEI